MNENLIFLIIAAVILGILFTRLIFSIPTIVRNLKSQTNLLCLIAKKSGATDQEIENAIVSKTTIVKLDA
jgi:hypothetical protein